MIDKIFKTLFSNRLTVVLLVIFGAAMAYATFMENDYGTPAARTQIYDAWWFELVMVLLSLNFVGNIWKYQLWRKEKIAIFIFHIAFIVTILGAFVTRYFSYEGIIRVREGQESNQLVSLNRYFDAKVEFDGKEESIEKQLTLSYFAQPNINEEFGESNPLKVTSTRYVPNAVQGLVDGDPDSEILELVTADENGRRTIYLVSGESAFIKGKELTFNKSGIGSINIKSQGDSLIVTSPLDLTYMIMSTQLRGALKAGTTAKLHQRALYQAGEVSFVIAGHHKGKTMDYQTTFDKQMAESAADLLIVDLETEKSSERVVMAAIHGVVTPPRTILLDDYKITLNFGPRVIELPFSLYLKDFQLERYPGSSSPSSYASEVIVRDGGDAYPYRIFMNNVLDHGGFRFFQASYDTDELGTVLSVNRDYWGTQITYLGYTLMCIGMILTLFGKGSRFQLINKRLSALNAKATMLTLAILASFASLADPAGDFVIAKNQIVSKEHAAKFGELLVQDMDGRIKPVNTLASEFTRKLYRSSKLKVTTESGESLDANQVFLALSMDAAYWQNVPLIKVHPDKGAKILDVVGKDQELLAFTDLIDQEGNYLISEWVEQANRKKPAERSEFDKEVMTVDERFNILFQAFDRYYLKLFPKRGDIAETWFNEKVQMAGFESEDSLFVVNILRLYRQNIAESYESGNWTGADTVVSYIDKYQTILGESVIPSEGRQRAELNYNKWAIFNKLFGVYWLIGLLALMLAIARVFVEENKVVKYSLYGLLGLTGIAFGLHTFNIILRWYAGDYPPWSNGYEMIILVSWFLMLFGFIFIRRSNFVLPLATLFSGTLLFVAFLDWLNPEITNLVPVLKSYWLKIHVAIIVGSYAPLALSALLGLLALIFYLLPRTEKLDKSIDELTYINEMSMTIGLFMLAIGTFLGGVWANESWGRYWGWDPKETWALISVVVYTVILHLRLVPQFRGTFTFNLWSVFGFYSIIMTSYGVNYYLSGLHSYAAGDPLPIPKFLYWLTGTLIAISIASYLRKNQTQAKLS